VATTGSICEEKVENLMAKSIEKRFGVVDQPPQSIEWLSDDKDSASASHETPTSAV
jgi:hypothetical protein